MAGIHSLLTERNINGIGTHLGYSEASVGKVLFTFEGNRYVLVPDFGHRIVIVYHIYPAADRYDDSDDYINDLAAVLTHSSYLPSAV